MLAVNTNNLVKYYNKIPAINEISIAVEQKELFGIIGPDGAGKTTLLRILSTMLLPDEGSATIEGFDLVKEYKLIRKTMGFMPGKFSLYQDMSVDENINFYATMFGTTLKENRSLIQPIYKDIEPFKKRLAGKLSGGMQQKLALCCALIHRPTIIFLDEPTRGVDPVSRKDLWNILKELKKENITVLVSTAYMEEANLCSRVALIDKGKILDLDTPENLKQKFNKPLFAISAGNTFQLIQSLKQFEYANSVYPFGDYVHYTDKREHISEQDLTVYLQKHGFADVFVKQMQPTIEDYFIKLTDKNNATTKQQ